LFVAGSCWILSGSSSGNFEPALDLLVRTKFSCSQDMVAFKVMTRLSTGFYWQLSSLSQASLCQFQVTQRLLGVGFVICHWKHALDKRPKLHDSLFTLYLRLLQWRLVYNWRSWVFRQWMPPVSKVGGALLFVPRLK
jgi:hypothetical protein